MTAPGVTVEESDGVRHVVLDRPEKKNAITAAMYATLADALETACDAGVGAVLLGARGAAFTAGNDLRDFLDHPPADDEAPVFRFLMALARNEVPLIAAVRGAAVGIGTTLLLHCDLVYAAPTARFTVPFVDLGLVPENASSVLLPRALGRARAGAALYLGDALDAAGAYAAGMVTAVVADDELDAVALAAARAIAAKPREAVRATKRLVDHDRAEIVAAIRREGAVFRERLASGEARAAMAAFFQRGSARA
ncbi:MAG TPA: enoyl-CoA hydratase-related protein [Candidatus Limnocylindria bacterium]|jgi:enoyl-CoA hydratase/carnithine racemase|nr:enoyl-CoA hydratase-related protein [Candidatus Limnocylindria bacterium]